jgi:UDP-2,3-diacylglucosamine hydrolase
VAKIGELLALVRRDGDRLVILGDLFDFWFEYKHAIPKEHTDVLLMLKELSRDGVRVDYVSGNHDFWMDDYFQTQIGLTMHRDSLEIEYAGRRIFMTHGDGLAKADRGYRFLKRVLYRKLPPDWAIPLAKWVSGSSRHYTSRRDHTFAPDYERFAEAKIGEGYQAVFIGHLHIPVRKQFERGVYINTGDFIHHFSYGRVDGSGVDLRFLKS